MNGVGNAPDPAFDLGCILGDDQHGPPGVALVQRFVDELLAGQAFLFDLHGLLWYD